MTAKEPERHTLDLRSLDYCIFLAAENYGLSPENIRQISARFKELQSSGKRYDVARVDHLW